MTKIAIHTPAGWAIIDEEAGVFYGFVKKPALNQAVNQDTARLAAIDTIIKQQQPTNAELLAWAKINYPLQHGYMDYSAEIAALDAEVATATENLPLIAQAGG